MSDAANINSEDQDQPFDFGSLGGDGKLDEQHLNIALVKDRRIDNWMRWVSDQVSAILVKETRQALNSRQFLWTFFGLLIVVVFYSMFIISTAGLESSYLGPVLLNGFLIILGFPLAIVLPFATFRSMAKEFEDGTLQMISITTMRPHQIALGKLGNALLQMLMFVSIFAPCMVFSSLLPGVSFGQIMLCLFVAIAGSLSLCSLGLFLGCRVRSGLFGVFGNLVLLAILVTAYWLYCVFTSITSMEERAYLEIIGPVGSVFFWGTASLVLSTGALCFVASTAMIAFDTENRATPIRIALLVQQFLFFAFVIGLLGFTRRGGAESVFNVFVPFYGHYWLVLGSLLISTFPIVGNRVRRSFPKSRVGQAIGGLLMPGTGRAYLFTVSNIIGCALMFCVLILGYDQILLFSSDPQTIFGTSTMDQGKLLGYVFLNTVYPILFLSMTYFVLSTLKRMGVRNFGPMFGLLIGVFMSLLLALGGMLIQYSFFYFTLRDDYSVLKAFNWWSTIYEYNQNTNSGNVIMAIFIVSVTTLVFFLYSFVHAARSTIFVAAATPDRVVEDQNAITEMKKVVAVEEDRFEDLFTGDSDNDESGNASSTE